MAAASWEVDLVEVVVPLETLQNVEGVVVGVAVDVVADVVAGVVAGVAAGIVAVAVAGSGAAGADEDHHSPS